MGAVTTDTERDGVTPDTLGGVPTVTKNKLDKGYLCPIQ